MCQFKTVVCNDNNFCTHDTCDAGTGCHFTPFNASECDDLNVCTTDSCIPAIGCVHTPINCDDKNNCTIDSCNSLVGCQNDIRDCSSEVPTTSCTAVGCNVVTGCSLFAVENLIQSCGKSKKCIDDGPCDNIATVASISAGVVAGIVIAGVAIFAAVGTVSGRAGYLAYMRNKNNMQGAQMSPLYQDNGLSGTNPFFEEKPNLA
jgi:hypothetical protein